VAQGWPGKVVAVSTMLAKLLDLQKQHLHLRSLLERSRVANVAVTIKEKQLARVKADLDRAVEGRKTAQRAGDSKDLEIKSLQAKITKFRDQLNNIKTNKEYQALQAEIKFTQAEMNRQEDLSLAEMEKVEKEVEKIDKAKAVVVQAEKELAEVKAKTAAEAEALAAEIRKAERDKADLARELPKESVEMFERVASKHDNGALCPLVMNEEDSEGGGYCCGGCFMRLTENVYVKLRGHAEELILCPNCAHILYLEP
jgi:hypothetical protein